LASTGFIWTEFLPVVEKEQIEIRVRSEFTPTITTGGQKRAAVLRVLDSGDSRRVLKCGLHRNVQYEAPLRSRFVTAGLKIMSILSRLSSILRKRRSAREMPSASASDVAGMRRASACAATFSE
jgi:hypothetical protein